jgi:hypothetical protein
MFRFGQLGRHGGDHEAHDRNPEQAAESAQSTHTSKKSIPTITLHVLKPLLQAG